MKNVYALNMKNLKKNHGGTKMFTVFLSDSKEGPWHMVYTDEFSEPETYGCGLMQTFEFGYSYKRDKKHLKCLCLGKIEFLAAF